MNNINNMNNPNYGFNVLPDITLEMISQQCQCQHNNTSYLNNNFKKQEYGLTGIESYQNNTCYSNDAKNILLFLMLASVSYLIYSNIKHKK